MDNKFKLSHVVLYSRGYYNKSGDIWTDLKQILQYDDYTPFSNNDVFWIITNSFEKADLGGYTNTLLQTLIGIQQTECWKYGYECTKETYDMATATMYYILSTIRFIDRTKWDPKVPKYNKITPRPKNIALKTIIEFFNTKKTHNETEIKTGIITNIN